jgi:cellulose biosynthesis protein BcsQ
MSINKLSVVVTPEKDATIQQLLDNLLAELDFLLILAIDDRLRLVKMGRRDLDFVYRGLKHALGTPVFLPSYLSLNVFKEDVDFATWLRKVEKKLGLIATKIKDTALVAEAEAYQSARLYYNSVKAAARAGNEEAEKITIELAKHFKKKIIANDENPLSEKKKQ